MEPSCADSSPVLYVRKADWRGGGARSPLRISSSTSKKTLEWVPLDKHPLFSSRSVSRSTFNAAESTISASDSADAATTPSAGVLQNFLSWDPATSRLYLWDAKSRCLHRLAVRFPEPDDVSSPSSSLSATVEAASVSEQILPDIEIRCTVHQISLNTNGSTLLLFGPDELCVIYLYDRTSNLGDKIYCRTVLLGSSLFSIHKNGLRTLQASWHPYSSNHLGVLSSDSVFRLFDLSADLEQAEQEFYLQPEPIGSQLAVSVFPLAFWFGGQQLWERFSVFILYSNGALYILCPVVPFGSLCNWTHIKEIYEDAHVYGLKSSNSRVSKNMALAVTWLEATFPQLIDRLVDDDSVLVSRAHPFAPLGASLALQGPLVYISQGEKISKHKASISEFEGRPVSFLYNSIGKDSVFVIAWSSGFLQIDALAEEVLPLWNDGSSPHVHFDISGNIEGVAMICQSNLELVSLKHKRLDAKLNNEDIADVDGCSNLPRLLRLSTVDLSLPKDAIKDLLFLFSDPLLSERMYCLHNCGLDMIILHFLPFSNLIPGKEEIVPTPPSVHPILTTSHAETYSPSVLCGFLVMADSYGHSQFVGVTPAYECLVLDVKGWNEMLPFHPELDMKSADSTETFIPEIISKELLNGPKAILVSQSTSLRTLIPGSIEGRSTLHHYIKLFHENYIEYAHKVYIELEQHSDYLKTIIKSQAKRLKGVEQSLLKVENQDNGMKDRFNRAFKVYELLGHRLDNFMLLPAASKKPLTKAESEFNAELDRIANLELNGLQSSIEALNARLKRYLQSSQDSSSSMERQTLQRRNPHVSSAEVSHLKSSLNLLSSINSENTDKIKLIDGKLNSQEK
ncbi:hypothetical protein AXF42_Ash004022 [Apostasia shenzhenica]|uniref:Nuclear pore complex protein NUP88 n=1 Tax=Apostasia shenzhenica TaxID=1088818 RepID=A0A2I0AIJ9_9ASPA|nr:hypothetical protein AXF42_Ash004022 [Apostasia shenzhenica]